MPWNETFSAQHHRSPFTGKWVVLAGFAHVLEQIIKVVSTASAEVILCFGRLTKTELTHKNNSFDEF